MRWNTRTLAFAVVLAACGSDAADVCVVPPCAPSTAITLTVTSASTGATLSSVFVNVLSGPGYQGVAPAGCVQDATTTCGIHGDSGTYQLEIGAPGFQTVRRTLSVGERAAPKCGCGGADTQHIDVALVPTT
jgi:hypothetical protein